MFELYPYVNSAWTEYENKLHEDYEIYSTASDLSAGSRPWTSVEYSDDKGFPGTTLLPGLNAPHWTSFHGSAGADGETDASIWIQLKDSAFIDGDYGWSGRELTTTTILEMKIFRF